MDNKYKKIRKIRKGESFPSFWSFTVDGDKSIFFVQDAVKALNGLQSNAAYIRNVRNHPPKTNNKLDQTRKYLKR